MPSDEATRRLTAILAADVVGYSRLTSTAEEETIAAFRRHRSELIDPMLATYNGRIANTAGDSFLIEFPSVVQALRFAVEVQRGMHERNAVVAEERRIRFRMGLNLGDVIDQEGDLLGDGVNVAARLESLAEPGGIWISRAARDQVRDRLDVELEDLGELELKNIARRVRAFRVVLDGAPARMAGRRRSTGVSARTRRLAIVIVVCMVVAGAGSAAWLQWPVEAVFRPESSLSAGTSLAVLPFANLGQSPGQDYFADGMTNDLITDLSRFRDLFVIASNSAFAYRDGAEDPQKAGRELKVRYVLKGSVQRDQERVRINAQLIEVGSGQLLWAERYDEAVSDLFDLQEMISRRIVRTLAVELTRLEQDRAFAKAAPDLEAYDYVLRGRQLLSRSARDDNFEARRLFQMAIDRDPGYGAAYAGLGRTFYEAVLFGWTGAPQESLERAHDLAQKAISADSSSADGHALLSGIYLIRRQYDLALIESERAIAINPNDAGLHATQGAVLVWSSRPDGATLALETALRYDPLMGPRSLTHLGMAYYLTGRHEDAVAVLERAIGRNPNYAHGQVMLAATYGKLGRQDEAQRAAAAVRRLDPFFSTERFGLLLRDPADAAAIVDGLHAAGFE